MTTDARKKSLRRSRAKWKRENPGKNAAGFILYKLRKMNRVPPWADTKAIEQIYVDKPSGLEVDHIVPLRGDNVSGLHVAANLQYLTKAQNRSKKNKHTSGE